MMLYKHLMSIGSEWQRIPYAVHASIKENEICRIRVAGLAINRWRQRNPYEFGNLSSSMALEDATGNVVRGELRALAVW